MRPHLSADQLSECMLGRPSRAVAQHVEDCAACRRELRAFREALGGFRSAVGAWSDDQAQRALASPVRAPEARWSASQQLALAAVVAAIFVLASFVMPRDGRDKAAANDATLLNQVDAEVSRTAPSSMEPLMKLVADQP